MAKYYATTEGGYADRYVDQGYEYLGDVPKLFDMSVLGEFQYQEITTSEIGTSIRRVYMRGETNCMLHVDYNEVSEYAVLIYK